MTHTPYTRDEKHDQREGAHVDEGVEGNAALLDGRVVAMSDRDDAVGEFVQADADDQGQHHGDVDARCAVAVHEAAVLDVFGGDVVAGTVRVLADRYAVLSHQRPFPSHGLALCLQGRC